MSAKMNFYLISMYLNSVQVDDMMILPIIDKAELNCHQMCGSLWGENDTDISLHTEIIIYCIVKNINSQWTSEAEGAFV